MLTSPVVANITSSSRNFSGGSPVAVGAAPAEGQALNDAQDYLLKMPSQVSGTNGVQIQGGRDLIILGGEISIPASPGSESASRGLYLLDQVGTVHVEGVHFTGAGLGEGIQLNQKKGAVVQLGNLRFNAIVSGAGASWHGDIIQSFGGPRVLRIDKLTGVTDYQALYFDGIVAGFADIDILQISNVNVSDSVAGDYNVMLNNFTTAQTWFENIYHLFGAAAGRTDQSNFGTLEGFGVKWKGVNIVNSAPPGGDIVPLYTTVAGVGAGIGYVPSDASYVN